MKRLLTVFIVIAVSLTMNVSFAGAATIEEVWAWGYNGDGQLGDGTTTNSNVPLQVIGLIDATAIATGYSHSLAVKSDGTVWAWGDNALGQLGDGTITDSSVPVQVSGLTGVIAIGAGNQHSLAVKSDGTVWAWGDNALGQLGDGTTTGSSTPVQVSGLTGAIGVAAGLMHSLAVKSDGTVWAWGLNNNGQLGDGTGSASNVPVQVSGLTGAIAIGAGYNHSLAARSDGTAWAWGHNGNGQLGDGTTTSSNVPVQVSGLTNIVAVDGGWTHSMALKSYGSAWAWGSNTYGWLGDGTTTSSNVPVQVSGLSGAVAISAGNTHSAAVKSDGTAWAWGRNSLGQLGDGTTSDSNVPVQVSDLDGATAVASGGFHNLALAGAPLSITTTSPLPDGQVGVSYSQGLSASGGTPPYTWSISAGSLPDGLSLDPSSGSISGMPTNSGTSGFTVMVMDDLGDSATKPLSITINPSDLTITTDSLPGGTVGIPYSQALAASGGTPPYTWSISAGSLPDGLSLGSSSGSITGIPTSSGTSGFTVMLTDDHDVSVTRPLSIAVDPSDLAIVTDSLPDGVAGIAYSQVLAASGGTPPYTWSVSSGALPDGLSLNPSSGIITGMPTSSGTSGFTVMVTDSHGVSVTKPFSITINPEGLIIITDSLPDVMVGIPYSQNVMAGGGVWPYSWSVSSGALPDGLSLDPFSGSITGMPTNSGTSAFTVMVNDSLGDSVTKALSITVVPALTITTASLPDAMECAPYSQTLAASGGSPPYTWSISAGSPPLELDPVSGVMTGVPFYSGTWDFTVMVADSQGFHVTRPLSVTVIPNDLTIVTDSLPDGMVDYEYSHTLAASGGTPPYTWSISEGTLPAALLLDASSGHITGLVSDNPDTYLFTAELGDSAGAFYVTKPLSITVVPNDLTIVTDSLPDGTVGIAYSQALVASGGVPPYAWSISAGYLPAGLSLASSGHITGTPDVCLGSGFDVIVIDSLNVHVAKTMTIGIGCPNGVQATLKSPGELRVYDSQDRVTGLVSGTVIEEIPDSSYNSTSKTVLISPATDSYYYQVAGTESGTYGLEIVYSADGQTVTFSATDIPTSSGAMHRYTTDWDALHQGEEGVTVHIDSDGDGIFERTITSDNELTGNEFIPLSGCFIATAAYGTPMADEVDALRDFRDEYLLTNPLGQVLVAIYCRLSPPVADFIAGRPELKPIVRTGLVPAVAVSTLVVNTTLTEKTAMLSLLVLISVATAIWAIRRGRRRSEHA